MKIHNFGLKVDICQKSNQRTFLLTSVLKLVERGILDTKVLIHTLGLRSKIPWRRNLFFNKFVEIGWVST